MDALRASIGDKGKTAAAKRKKAPAKKAAKAKKSA
jgi:hypothetical protein